MPTIYASPYLVDVLLTVDGKDCSFTVSRAIFNRTYNKASTLILEIIGLPSSSPSSARSNNS